MSYSLADISRSHGERAQEAVTSVIDDFPYDRYQEVKRNLVAAVERLNRDLETRPLADQSQKQDLLDDIIGEAYADLGEIREDVTRRWGGADELPNLPVSTEQHQRYERILNRLRLEDDRGFRHNLIRDEIIRAAGEGELPLVQELLELVQQEKGRSRFDELPDQHPLAEAEQAAHMALESTDLLKGRVAREQVEDVETELEDVFRTIRERGEWSGPRARIPRDDLALKPEGPVETSYRTPREKRPDRIEAFEKAVESAPSVDERLGEYLEAGAYEDDDPRSRFRVTGQDGEDMTVEEAMTAREERLGGGDA